MKKIIVIALVVIANTVMAQKQKLIQKVNGGMILATLGSTTFQKGDKPFDLAHNLFAVVTVVTPKTFHNFFYGLGNNSLNTLNGYFLKKNWDTYLVYSKNLNTGGNYLGWGIEKMEKIGNVKFFEFCEIGTAFNGHPILSFGLLLNVSWSLKK